MSKQKGEERIINDDGSQLKVQYYDDKIVVHEKGSRGNTTGRVTDHFSNPSVHVHDDKDGGSWWEGGGSSKENSYSSNDDNSSGGCFITSAVCANLRKADDCEELTMFRHFRDTFMQETVKMQEDIKEYYNIAPKICNAIDSLGKHSASKEYARIWKDSLEPAFASLSANNKQEAYKMYKEMVIGLKEHYLTD